MVLTQKIIDAKEGKKLLFLFAVNSGLSFDSHPLLVNIQESIICVEINGKWITALYNQMN